MPLGVKLRELRGFAFGPDGNLYVANAFHDYSQVLRFKGSLNANGQHDFIDVFVARDPQANPGLHHPFNLVFDREGDLFVTSQDSCLVSKFYGPSGKSGKPGAPAPIPVGITCLAGQCFQPGTFIPSAKQSTPGLTVVREAAFGPDGLLYVVDRDADGVHKYDSTSAKRVGSITAEGVIDKPIHLLFHPRDEVLLIGNRGRDSVAKHDLQTGTTTTFIHHQSGGLREPSGMAWGEDGYLYVASRGSKQILRYHESDGKPDKGPFISHLLDEPEFILHVAQK
jgi:DNA-binding beta-propeller fold protein YncE